MLLLGCAERPEPAAAPSPAAREAFAARVLATRDQAHRQAATRLAEAPPVVWPAPVSTATGGKRIDLRGVPDHIHTLERQPDGTWRSFCRDPRQVPTGSGR
ncbi:MAG TPA: hypothetical protein VN853_06775 [Polyangia bacterium]|jgi:hypothetical protein|nr:hypothetical protein [Polyangia bacterium]